MSTATPIPNGPPARVVAAVSQGEPRRGAMCSWLPSIPATTIDPSSRRAR